jgi:hypothetical protein
MLLASSSWSIGRGSTLALLLVTAPLAAEAINWEDAPCMAVTGNTTRTIDSAPEQVHVTFGKNHSSYVVNWVSQLTLKGFDGDFASAKPNNDWPVLTPTSHGATYRSCLVQSHVEWGPSSEPGAAGWLRASSAARLYTEPMCGTTRLMHSVIMYGVDPAAPVWYRVRSFGGEWSAVKKYTPVDPSASSLTAVFTFDMASRESGSPSDPVCPSNITVRFGGKRSFLCDVISLFEKNQVVCQDRLGTQQRYKERPPKQTWRFPEQAVPDLVAAAAADVFDVGFHGGDTSYNLDDNCGRTGDDFMNVSQSAEFQTKRSLLLFPKLCC